MGQSLPSVVVGLDFGTTYSGFAFAHRSNPEDVQLFIDWPNATRPYCKTQTSLFYVFSGETKEFQLQDWGWTALSEYSSALQSFRSRWVQSNDSPPSREDLLREVGILVTSFKLYLAGPDNSLPDLPSALTPERMITDYLRCISNFILDHLKEKYGKTFANRDVQWCLTVPAIWSEKSKMQMEMYAEKAGMVQGKHCSNPEASGFPLKIILEPEAASFSCQKQLKDQLQLYKGDKFIVADVGGGTIDIVVHEKAEQSKERVKEVSASYGDLGGGTFVDRNFFQFLKQTISCFDSFKDEEPVSVHRILSWWLGTMGKCTFGGTGSKFMEVPRKLSKVWKKHDKENGNTRSGEFYEELEISEGSLKTIFDTEVSKVVELVRKELKGGVKYIFLVGGFAENSYLLNRVRDEFRSLVKDVISIPNSGAAICRGAVAMGFETGVVITRVSKRSYGIRVRRRGDDHGFDVFVRKNQSVPVDSFVSRSYVPIRSDQVGMAIELFSSESDVDHTKDPSCQLLGKYELNIKEDLSMGCDRSVSVFMYFGRATIEVSAQRLNFGSNRKREKLYSVQLET